MATNPMASGFHSVGDWLWETLMQTQPWALAEAFIQVNQLSVMMCHVIIICTIHQMFRTYTYCFRVNGRIALPSAPLIG